MKYQASDQKGCLHSKLQTLYPYIVKLAPPPIIFAMFTFSRLKLHVLYNQFNYHLLIFYSFYVADQHEKALTHLFRELSERQTTILLVNHLLTQLLPIPTNYFLDITSKAEEDGCPCSVWNTCSIWRNTPWYVNDFYYRTYFEIINYTPANKVWSYLWGQGHSAHKPKSMSQVITPHCKVGYW